MSFSPKFRGETATGAIDASRKTQTNFQNASGSTLVKSTPVAINTSSQLVFMDVSDEALVSAFVGLTSMDIPNSAIGSIIDNGRLENITTPYAVGDSLYVSKIGGLTNVKPDIGFDGFVAGDFVIFVGVVVKNEFNALLKDIKLFINIVGQL